MTKDDPSPQSQSLPLATRSQHVKNRVGTLSIGHARSSAAKTQKMLIQTLRKLECYGLVERTVYPVVPPKVEYALTPFKPYCTRVPLSRCRLSACTVRCNVVFTYHSGISSTSIFFASAARTSASSRSICR